MTDDRAVRIRSLLATIAACLLAGLSAWCTPAAASGIQNIQHVIVLMQENRSFDQYFGTYPGADGIPTGICLPDPMHGGCIAPYHDPSDLNYGGPHHAPAWLADYDNGLMDGFVKEAEVANQCSGNPTAPGCTPCTSANTSTCLDIMGYHDAREIPNYWTYAQNFVLQDHMFSSVRSWSLPEHLYDVSGWSASCTSANPLSCTTFFNQPGNGAVSGPHCASAASRTICFPWTDITWLLHKYNVSWAYYVFKGNEPDCEVDSAVSCTPVKQGPTTYGIWNPLPFFTDVQQDQQVSNVQSLNCMYAALNHTTATGCPAPTSTTGCGLPHVAWIIPNGQVSEHYPGTVSAGQAFVTTTVNAIMHSPCWSSSAIFVSWDDWGGFYDHVTPPTIPGEVGVTPATPAGYGFRVPGMLISPYARRGYIDHQTLSHDAYLKFIEADFLGGQQLNPNTDGRPDSRPDVRESAAGLGDLANEFDFTQTPLAPLVLPTHPAPGPASCPPGGCPVPQLQLTVSLSRQQRVHGRHPAITLVVGCSLPCSLQVRTQLSVVSHHRHLTLRTIALSLAPNRSNRIKLRLSRAQVRAILDALRHHRRVIATVRVRASSGSGVVTYLARVRLR